MGDARAQVAFRFRQQPGARVRTRPVKYGEIVLLSYLSKKCG